MSKNEEKDEGVLIQISGREPLLVKATAAVVGDALTQHGFTDVRARALNETPPAGTDYLPSSMSNMDMIRRMRPELLAAPVEVEYLHGDISERVEGLLNRRHSEAKPWNHSQIAANPHQDYQGDNVIGAEVPLSPAQEQEQEFDIAAEITGNVGAVDGDPVAADPEEA